MIRRTFFSTSLLIALALSSGCAYRTQERQLTRSMLTENPDRTRMTNFMSAPRRFGSPTEETPGQVAREAVLDEAKISRFDDEEVCVTILQRTNMGLDIPLSQWKAYLNGEELYIEEGPISVVDYPVTGERAIFSAQAILPDAFGSLRLTEPTKEIYRVYEREGVVCGVRPPERDLELELVLPMDDRRGHWGELYVWRLP